MPAPPADGEGVPAEVPVDPAKSERIQAVLANRPGPVELPDGVSVSQRARRKFARQLSGAAAIGEDESGTELPDDEQEQQPDESEEPDDDDGGSGEFAPEEPDPSPETDEDSPDMEEELRAETGGRRGRHYSAPVLPQDAQPRQVQQVIRDPRLAAKARAGGKLRQVPGLKAPEIARDREAAAKPSGSWGQQQPPENSPELGAKSLSIGDRHRAALEALLQRPISSGAELVQAVSAITETGVGGFDLEFTAPERAEIAKRAAFNGRSPEAELRAAFQHLKPVLFASMVVLAGNREISGKRGA